MSDCPLTSHARAMFEVIERYQASGVSQKAFCQSEGLALSTFQYWLARYRKHQHCDAPKESRQLFVELKPALPGGGGEPAVTVSYPNGVVVCLGAAVDLTLLKELIAL